MGIVRLAEKLGAGRRGTTNFTKDANGFFGEGDKRMGAREWGGWGWVNETGGKMGGRKKGNHEWHEGREWGLGMGWNVEL
jgi:hypothetical protein